MPNVAAEKQQPGIQKKSVYLSFLVLFCCAVAAAVLICTRLYETEKKDILDKRSAMLSKDVRDSATRVVAWRDELKTQASRISSSELYRLFALEANQLDAKVVGRLNEAENVSPENGDLAALVEQVPLMRNVLLDFLNYTAFADARIVNAAGQNLLSAHTRPTALTPPQLAVVRHAIESGKLSFSPLRSGATALLLDVADPLHAVLSGEGRDKSVAALLLTTPVTGQVGRILGGADNRLLPDAATYLLQRNGNIWENVRLQGIAALPEPLQSAIVPDKDGQIPFGLRSALNGRGEAYSVGYQTPGMNWWIVAELPAAFMQEALGAAARRIAVLGALACLGFLLLLPLLWWLAVGRGQHAMALRFRDMYHTIQRQKQLLDSINVSLDVGLFMTDSQGEIQMCNRAFVATLGEAAEEQVRGKTLFMFFQGTSSERLLAGVTMVLRENKPTTFEVDRQSAAGRSLFRVSLFPFVESEGGVSGVVGTMQDITAFRRRSIQQQRQQIQTMSAFMRAIESVDPYLAGHSQMMNALGVLVARYMKMSERDVRTISVAAELSQVGRLSLPQDLLRKEGTLSDSELEQFRRVPQYAYSILKDIAFDLPVAEAVYAMSETMDGKGYPRGLTGAGICIHARVLAVLNAFCAMISPRSYREGLSVDNSLKILGSDPRFDQDVVNALHGVLDTADGAEVLRQRRQKRRET